MAETLPLMQKVLVWKFYRDNTAFFLLVIVLCFGFLSGREHVALAEGFIGSYITLMIPISVWILYTLKVIRYNYQSTGAPVNAVLQHTLTLKPAIRHLAILVVAVLQLLPVWIYGCFIGIVAMVHDQFQITATVVMVVILLLIFCSVTLPLFILHAAAERKTFFIQDVFNKKFSRPLAWIEVEHTLRSDPFMVLSTKLFSCILIAATASLYKYDEYDWRLMALGSMLAFSGNIVLMKGLHTMRNHSLMWLRNMPLSLQKRILITIVVISVLSIPEGVAIFRNLPAALGFAHGISIFVFGMSFQFLFYSMFYLAKNQKNRGHYLLILVTLLLIQFHVPLWLLTAVNAAFAAVIYSRTFYEFEYTEIPARSS
jgi:hypothetical protein